MRGRSGQQAAVPDDEHNASDGDLLDELLQERKVTSVALLSEPLQSLIMTKPPPTVPEALNGPLISTA